VELRDVDLSCCLNSIRSVGLWKCLYDHYLASKAYFSDVTVKNIYESFTHKMAAKASWHRNYVTVTPYVYFCVGLDYFDFMLLVSFIGFVLFFSNEPRDWLGITSPKWPIFVEWDVKPSSISCSIPSRPYIYISADRLYRKSIVKYWNIRVNLRCIYSFQFIVCKFAAVLLFDSLYYGCARVTV